MRFGFLLFKNGKCVEQIPDQSPRLENSNFTACLVPRLSRKIRFHIAVNRVLKSQDYNYTDSKSSVSRGFPNRLEARDFISQDADFSLNRSGLFQIKADRRAALRRR